LIGERLPATLELAFVSGMFALIGGLALGVYTALRRKGFLPRPS
jgi:peptide/nickel transport system permease protein